MKLCPGCRNNRVFIGNLCARCQAIQRELEAFGWRRHFRTALYVQEETQEGPLHLADGPILRLYWN